MASEQEKRELTPKEEMFCQQYLIDLNQTKAYQRAFDQQNYGSAASAASLLMKNINVSTRVKELLDERVKQLNLDQQWVLNSLVEIRDKAMQAKPVMKWNFDTKQMEETGEYTFDGNSANKATELIGKHAGMWKDKLEVKVQGDVVITGRKFAQEDGDKD